jgi:hypothetical protein
MVSLYFPAGNKGTPYQLKHGVRKIGIESLYFYDATSDCRPTSLTAFLTNVHI